MNDFLDLQPRTWSDQIPVAGWHYHDMMKRVVDLVAASIIMILLSPLFLVIAIGVRLSSPGSIFYRQERIGRDGRPFHMFKFRTMFNGSSSSTHREHVQNLIINDISPADLGKASLKLNDDPRITPFGRWLRTLSLDEMPQFINVLRGEMSIVGPRPPVAYEYELYSNWHKQRMLVLPGITGLWQVTAHNQVSFNEMVEIDLDYIRKMDLWLDLKIMIMTPLEMLSGKGGG